MKLTFFLFAIAMLFLLQKSTAQYVTFICGDNQVRLDSTINLTCDFFTDSLIKIHIDKSYTGNRFQVSLFPEEGQSAVAWYNIDEYTRSATIKWRMLLKDGCVKGKWYIMYQKKEINIQNYIVNVEL